MCQLLGMNSFKPAQLSFSLEGFLRRGGETGEHADGWGIALYEGQRCHLLIDEQASAKSPLAQWVQEYSSRSRNIIAHIRKATQGEVSATNCHPFMRHLWGQEWSFAHNGNLDLTRLPRPVHFQPVGQTDSELAFCLLLDALALRFGAMAPPPELLHAVLADAARVIAASGTFNFVLSNGERLFAHRSTELHYVLRAHPFGRALLLDCPLGIDFAQINHPDDRMVIIATAPLTDEVWLDLPQGELVAFAEGILQAHSGEGAIEATPSV
jgi:predicted glutamine amidotransferase